MPNLRDRFTALASRCAMKISANGTGFRRKSQVEPLGVVLGVSLGRAPGDGASPVSDAPSHELETIRGEAAALHAESSEYESQAVREALADLERDLAAYDLTCRRRET